MVGTRRLLSGVVGLLLSALGTGAAAGAPPKVAYKQPPILERAAAIRCDLAGFIGIRSAVNQANWLLAAPAANPAMLQMFRDRDRTPRRDLVPWAGEFAGKYLISAAGALSLTANEALEEHLRGFAAALVATQAADGYFGPFPKDARMTGKGLWDLWGQYHVMLGLLRYYEATGNEPALAAARRCADYFCTFFLDGQTRVLHAGSEEMNQSCAHIFALLYRQTGEPRYLQLLRAIEKDWQVPPSGDYVRTALAGKAFHQTPKPRWESLHAIQAIAELYFLTGDEQYKKAFEQLWWSILAGDRHNTGGFSSGEQATGNPYDPRAIETCCTIAWMAVTLDYLRMSGDARAADELELATFNAVLGAQHPSGRWWTYNTPMDGERKASAHEIVFQARAGSPELNCCSVNAPRGLGILPEWAALRARDGAALHFYGSGAITLSLPSGRMLRLVQETDYPRTAAVRIRVEPQAPESFTLHLRIPGWSAATQVKVNGRAVPNVEPGKHLPVTRLWKSGDSIELVLDLAPWVWVGEREAAGKVSLYRGPVLLAYDPRFDTYDPGELPQVALGGLGKVAELPAEVPPPEPFLLVKVPVAGGRTLTLCDFATAGAAGNPYRSWLPAKEAQAVPFSRANPLRLQR